MTSKLPMALGCLAASLAFALAPPAASACGPDNCKGLSKEERARDKAEIKRMNDAQARYVQKRDAEYAKGWKAQSEHKAVLAAHQRRMAEWREAVRRCEAGDHRYCAR